MSSQTHWAACHKCAGLFYAGFDGGSVCPVDSRAHEQITSFDYELQFDVQADAHTHPGWAACPKCQGMFFDGFNNNKGVCPAGGQHDHRNTFAYALKHDLAGSGQPEWRSCSKCLTLYYGPFGGVCKTGGHHENHGSFNYVLAFKPGLFVLDQNISLEFIGAGYPPNSKVHLDYSYKTDQSHHTFGVLLPTTNNSGVFAISYPASDVSYAYFVNCSATDRHDELLGGNVIAIAPQLTRHTQAQNAGEG